MVDYTADTAARQQDDLDRLAARSLSARKTRGSPGKERSLWPWLIAGLLLALLLGMIASPWFERQVRSQMPEALQPEPLVAQDPRVDGLQSRLEKLEARPPVAPQSITGTAPSDAIVPLASRIAALEAQAAALQSTDATMASRLEQLAVDLQRTSGAAEAGDRQVRDLFLVSVARRMVESGRPLGPVLAALSARFSAQDAAAIDSLMRWSSVPHTRETLAARLKTMDATADVAAGAADAPGFWGRIMMRISGLVTVRDGTGPGPVESDGLAAARDALEGGDVALAAAGLQRAPASASRDAWLADAKALIAAEAALDRLEAMLLDAASADASALASAIVQPPPSAAAVPATGAGRSTDAP